MQFDSTTRTISVSRIPTLVILTFCFLCGCDRSTRTANIGAKSESGTAAEATQPENRESASKEKPLLEPWKIETSGEETINQLIGYAQMLRARRSQVAVEQRLKDRQTLIKIADRLTKEELDSNQKVATFRMKSQSLLALHSAGDTTAKGRVAELIESYLNDADVNLSRTAGFLDLSLAMTEYVQGESSTDANMRNKFKSMAEKYPGDLAVAKRLNVLTAQLIGHRKRPSAMRIMRDLQSVFSKSDDEAMKEVSERLKDRIHLVVSDHDIKVAEAMATRKSKRLKAAIDELLTYDGGIEIYQELIRGARILEQFDLYNDARALNEKIKNKFATQTDPKIVELAQRDTMMGNQRLELPGKPFEIIGVTKDGVSFNKEMIDGKKAILIIFWSAETPVSLRAMEPLLGFYSRFNADGLEIVSLCIDKNVEKATSVFGDRHPPWISLFSSNDAYQEKLESTGIQMLPYVILLDRNGAVDKIHVPLRDIEPNLMRLLGTSVDFEVAPGNIDDVADKIEDDATGK